MKLSIVATLYKSAASVGAFYERASAAAYQLVGDNYEIVLVNDGSPDNSLALAVDIAQCDAHVVVVDLSRNFGHHRAMMIGLMHARGERVMLIDSDLEEEPEWLSIFAQRMDDEGCDVIYGVQAERKGEIFERWSGVCFYHVFRMITGIELPPNVVTARLMSRRYVDALIKHDEREIFMAGLWYITGFDQRPQVVHKKALSPTTYSLRRKLSILVNSITSFSNAPLIGIFYCGVLISGFTGGYLIYLCVRRLLYAHPIGGWTSVMVSIWLLGGLIISFIGIIGVYLSKIFLETKRRPYAIVRQIYGRNKT